MKNKNTGPLPVFAAEWLTSGPWLTCRWIGGVESDFFRSFWLLTGGVACTRSTVVFIVVLCLRVIVSLYWGIVCYVKVVYILQSKTRLGLDLGPT